MMTFIDLSLNRDSLECPKTSHLHLNKFELDYSEEKSNGVVVHACEIVIFASVFGAQINRFHDPQGSCYFHSPINNMLI